MRLSVFFLLYVHLHAVYCAGFQFVTCGSVLKLVNPASGVRLHSHEVKYGSGSGQQSVTGVKQADDANSYWTVKGRHGEHCTRGEPISCGSSIRLQHLNTRLFLHSHLFSSPLSGNQEVSCFGSGGNEGGDTGDNWTVECDTGEWRRDDAVRLRHSDTKGYLHVSDRTYGRPINGQREICTVSNKSTQGVWKAMEGVYLEPENKNL